MLRLVMLSLALAAVPVALAQQAIENVDVFKEAGRYGGWPANIGIWNWGDEIVVGYIEGTFQIQEKGHAISREKPRTPRLSRSLDGGKTWTQEMPSFLDENLKEAKPQSLDKAIDFSHPDFAMLFRYVDSGSGFSSFYVSLDRCKNWDGPYALPTFDRKAVAARTDYVVLGPHDIIAPITVVKENGREGRVLISRTQDGGLNWDFVSWVTEEPAGFSIMPTTVRFDDGRLLTALRRKEGDVYWIEAWSSSDEGKTWAFVNRPAESTGGRNGNPGSMIRLRDGRLAITYGYRAEPFGIRARISGDEGATWGKEIILRDDGGCYDLGYPRMIQRADGKLVSIYYFNDAADKERYIAATIWDPGEK